MKKFIFLIVLIYWFLLSPTVETSSNSIYFYSDYYWESVESFISSPNLDDLNKISDNIQRYCEQIYLEATRRREYTKLEISICSELFTIKRQQELDYINYMYTNRGIY